MKREYKGSIKRMNESRNYFRSLLNEEKAFDSKGPTGCTVDSDCGDDDKYSCHDGQCIIACKKGESDTECKARQKKALGEMYGTNSKKLNEQGVTGTRVTTSRSCGGGSTLGSYCWENPGGTPIQVGDSIKITGCQGNCAGISGNVGRTFFAKDVGGPCSNIKFNTTPGGPCNNCCNSSWGGSGNQTPSGACWVACGNTNPCDTTPASPCAVQWFQNPTQPWAANWITARDCSNYTWPSINLVQQATAIMAGAPTPQTGPYNNASDIWAAGNASGLPTSPINLKAQFIAKMAKGQYSLCQKQACNC
jgi:hypothetical protein